MAMNKRCYKCKKLLPITEFNKNRTKPDGRQNLCKSCQRFINGIYRQANKEKQDADKGTQVDLKATRERYKKYWRENREKCNAAKRSYCQRCPEKRRAVLKVKDAVKYGKLIRPDICPNCGGKDSPIEAHHPDYNKPLDVIWLCSSCHRRLHIQLNEENGK